MTTSQADRKVAVSLPGLSDSDIRQIALASGELHGLAIEEARRLLALSDQDRLKAFKSALDGLIGKSMLSAVEASALSKFVQLAQQDIDGEELGAAVEAISGEVMQSGSPSPVALMVVSIAKNAIKVDPLLSAQPRGKHRLRPRHSTLKIWSMDVVGAAGGALIGGLAGGVLGAVALGLTAAAILSYGFAVP